MGHRRAARECALQMLYELDVGKHAEDEILHTFWQMNERSQNVRAFADELFVGTARRLKEIDKTIQQHATNWRLSRMAVVDRNILRNVLMPYAPVTPDIINQLVALLGAYVISIAHLAIMDRRKEWKVRIRAK